MRRLAAFLAVACFATVAPTALASIDAPSVHAVVVAEVPERVATNDGAWFYKWSHDAIIVEFYRFGSLRVIWCAYQISQRESGHYPWSDNGSHHGIFQLHNGFWGSVTVAAAQLGRRPTWYDPRINARVATWAFERAGRTFHRHWSATVPGGCP